jgi:hypothetical protein
MRNVWFWLVVAAVLFVLWLIIVAPHMPLLFVQRV